MRRRDQGLSLRTLALGALALWLVLPIAPLAIWSVSRSWYFPDLLPSAFSLDAWRYALSPVSDMSTALWNSLVVGVGATALAMLIGLPAGRALGSHRFRWKPLAQLVILAPTIAPGVAVAIGLHGVFLRLGLANSLLGVTLAHLIPTLPYAVLIIAAVFASHNPDFEAQARSLGASRWRTFCRITAPMLAPGLAVAALLAFLVSWSQYALTLLIGGGRVVTLPLLLFNFAAAGRNDLAGAIGVLYLAPGVVALVIAGRRLTGRGAGYAPLHAG